MEKDNRWETNSRSKIEDINENKSENKFKSEGEFEAEGGNIYLKILSNIAVYALIILCLILILPRVASFFLPFLIGWLISAIANPLVKFLEKRVKIVRKHSSAIIIILVIALVILGIYGLIQFVLGQVSSLINDIPNIVSIISDTIDQVTENLSGLFGVLPSDIQEAINQFFGKLTESLNSPIDGESVSNATISFARNVGDYILGILIAFISAYFFIKDRDTITKKARGLTLESVLEKCDLIVYYFKHAVGGYFKAQFKIMLIIIVIMYIGFKIIGTKYALLIAILTGLIDVLPVFGTGFVLWPWALVEFILGNYFNAVFLLIIYLVCQLVKNVLQPKMVGDSVGLHPLAALLFMYIGYKFMGFLGMIIGIPVGLIIVNLYRVGMFDNILLGLRILVQDINKYRKF